MKLKNLLYLISFILVIMGCSDESVEPIITTEAEESLEPPTDEVSEEPFSGPHFTLNVSNNLYESDSENWLVIHDSSGKLLNVSLFKNGETLQFESTSPEGISKEIIITLFAYHEFGEGNINYSLTTYAEIPRGSIWNLKIPNTSNSDRGDLLADATVVFDNANVIGSFDFAVSTKNGPLGSGVGTLNDVFQANFNLYEKDKRHLFTLNDRFIFVDDFPRNGFLTIDYNDLNDFDEKIEFAPLTLDADFSIHIQAFEDNQEFGLYEGYSLFSISKERSQNSTPKLFYLDEFNEYITSFAFFMENYVYNYRQVGGKTDKVNVPQNASLNVSNEAIADFSFDTNTTFNSHESFWIYNIGEYNDGFVSTSWKIESSKNINVPVTLPDEILQEYPELNIEELEYSYTRLFIGFDNYEEMLAKKFISTSPIYEVGFSEESLIFNKK
jgi:hypothetical protein